jgi:hypothetical protein
MQRRCALPDVQYVVNTQKILSETLPAFVMACLPTGCLTSGSCVLQTCLQAVNKIAEALHVFGIPFGKQPAAVAAPGHGSVAPSQGGKRRVAIDVGAAPGSWTAYLAGVFE